MNNTIIDITDREIRDLPNEKWKEIDGYDGMYFISCFGRIKSLYRKKESIKQLNTYNIVDDKDVKIDLNKNGTSERYSVTELVHKYFEDHEVYDRSLQSIITECEKVNIKLRNKVRKQQEEFDRFITKTDMKEKRNWTNTLIRDFYGEPDKITENRTFGNTIKLYDSHKAMEIEKTDEFQKAFKKSRERSLRRKKAWEKKLKENPEFAKEQELRKAISDQSYAKIVRDVWKEYKEKGLSVDNFYNVLGVYQMWDIYSIRIRGEYFGDYIADGLYVSDYEVKLTKLERKAYKEIIKRRNEYYESKRSY